MDTQKEKLELPKVKMVVNDFSEEYLRNISLLYEFNVMLFNKAYIVIGLFLVCTFIGLFIKVFLWFGLAGLVVIVKQYMRMKDLRSGISLERTVSNHKVNTGEKLQIRYTVHNLTKSKTPNLLLKDYTHYLNYKHENRSFALEPIDSESHSEIETHPICEAPSGDLIMGTVQVEIQDELGLFKLKLKFEIPATLYVSNENNKLTKEEIRKAKDSPLSGDLEVAKVGHGISLFGLREYRDGDPLRLISWKKSTMEEEFLVKELENDIARRVVFQISQDGHSHMGYGASSTWELTKAIALNLIRRYLNAHSSVSLVSDEVQLKDLSGLHILGLFEKTINQMKLRKSNYIHEKYTSANYFNQIKPTEDKFEMELVEHHLSAPCLYYYITSSTEDLESKIRYMMYLKSKGFEPMFVYVSPKRSSWIVQKVFKPVFAFGSAIKAKVDEVDIKSEFINIDIPLLVVEAKTTTGKLKLERYE